MTWHNKSFLSGSVPWRYLISSVLLFWSDGIPCQALSFSFTISVGLLRPWEQSTPGWWLEQNRAAIKAELSAGLFASAGCEPGIESGLLSLFSLIWSEIHLFCVCAWVQLSAHTSCLLNRISLCSYGWPGTYCIDHTGLEFTKLSLPLSRVLKLQQSTNTPGPKFLFHENNGHTRLRAFSIPVWVNLN